jgi:two-component system, OmpR family, KDP operon response regulator KdpE
MFGSTTSPERHGESRKSKRVTDNADTGTNSRGAPWEQAANAGAGVPIRQRKLILVIDDEEHEREIYGRMLLYNGFDVAFAGDAAHGLRLAAEHQPDLVLLDLGLPDASGVELCEALSALAWRTTPPIVVVLSAFTREDMGARSAAAGACEYIEKPASPLSVLHTVEEYLGRAPLAGDGEPPRVLAEVE